MLRLKVFIAQILISPFCELIKSWQQGHSALCQKVFDMGRNLIELLPAGSGPILLMAAMNMVGLDVSAGSVGAAVYADRILHAQAMETHCISRPP